MNAPRNQFSEADFQRAWQAAKDDVARLRDLGIGSPATMRPDPEDGYPVAADGEPMCADCYVVPVRHEGRVCMECKIDHAKMMRGDDY